MKNALPKIENQIDSGQARVCNADERILRLTDVIRITAISRSQIYKLVSEDRFPHPIKLCEGGRSSGWLQSEIQNFIAQRIAESRGGHV